MSDILMVFCAGSVGGIISCILTLAWVAAQIDKLLKDDKHKEKQPNEQTR